MEQAARMIHEGGAMAGIALKPKTPVAVLEPVIEMFEMVLVMSVEPGFSGQSYIEGSDKKVAEVVRMAQDRNPDLLIEVDGGMGVKTVGGVCAAGADVIVCGNAVYKASDPCAAIAEVAQAGDEARLAAGR